MPGIADLMIVNFGQVVRHVEVQGTDVEPPDRVNNG